jgi:hypothetical protein
MAAGARTQVHRESDEDAPAAVRRFEAGALMQDA